MIEEYNLSFLNLNNIKNLLLSIEGRDHGLVTKGISTYNYGKPVLYYNELQGVNKIIETHVNIFCQKYNISPLKFINSWFNITEPGNKLKAHDHGESVVSGAFYVSAGKNTVPLIFPDKEIKPYPGLLIIFSSNLTHYTKEEQDQRIVISFNTDYL